MLFLSKKEVFQSVLLFGFTLKGIVCAVTTNLGAQHTRNFASDYCEVESDFSQYLFTTIFEASRKTSELFCFAPNTHRSLLLLM